MTDKYKSTLLIIIFFLVVTIVMTYPLILNMGSGVRDLGDPLLNIWILDSTLNKASNLNFGSYFDMNIFYPHKNTLAYSEHLFTQSLIAFPIFLFVKNPVFVYNFVLLFSFFSSCLGMYFLVRYLTQNSSAAILAGLIYGFSPFMFAHLFHLQVITAGGIPLAFLFLHKFFQSETFKNLLLFSFFYILQVLANGYYALYLTFFAGIYFLLFFVFKQKYKDRRFWIKAAAVLIIIFVCLAPFFSQYLHVKKTMGFSRSIGAYANLKSYLSTSPVNRIYGKLTLPIRELENELFPGFTVFFLAFAGCLFSLKRKTNNNLFFKNPLPVYMGILVLSFLFTFGPKGPYMILYKFVPGFSSLRVASRFYIFVIFSLAVLAAYGYKGIAARLFPHKQKNRILIVLLASLLLLEFFSSPIPLDTVPTQKNIPTVYKWLAQRDEIHNLIELPLPMPKEPIGPIECLRIYYSIYHRKNIVNGYSGYFPPMYNELRKRWQTNSFLQNIQDLRMIGVDHILFHSHLFPELEREKLLNQFFSETENLERIAEIEETFIFRIKPNRKNISSLKTSPETSPFTGPNWKAIASINNDFAAMAIDGNIQTRWESGPQRKGVYFQLDLGQILSVRGISLKLGDKPNDYPRGFMIEISTDGTQWEKIHEVEQAILPITAFMKPLEVAFDVLFQDIKARYIRIVNTGEDNFYWSIFEIEVFE